MAVSGGPHRAVCPGDGDGTRGRTHSRCRSWKGAGPLSEALSSLSLGMSMGYMVPGSIFTVGVGKKSY